MKALIFMTVASMLLAARAVEAQNTSSTAAALETTSQPGEEVVSEPSGAPKVTEEDPEQAPAAAPATSGYTSDRAPPVTKRPYYLRGTVQFRTLAINDENPANTRSMLYGLELGYRIDQELTVFVRSGISQRFVVPSGGTSHLTEWQAEYARRQTGDLITSPFLLRDSTIGGAYRHNVIAAELPVSLAHYVNVYFPTSIGSQDRGLYFAPELANRARMQITENLSLGMDLGLQYRFHKYAEQYGPNGGLLTQFQVSTGLVADYNVADFGDDWGRIDAGAGVSWAWQNTFDDPTGDDRWRQDYGWDLSLFYTPRAWLSAGVSLEQGAPVLRDGRVNPVLFHRDEMELAFTVQATY